MDLPSEELEAWLAGLGAEHRALLPRLRLMLAERSVSVGFMAGSPKPGEVDRFVASAGERVGPTG